MSLHSLNVLRLSHTLWGYQLKNSRVWLPLCPLVFGAFDGQPELMTVKPALWSSSSCSKCPQTGCDGKRGLHQIVFLHKKNVNRNKECWETCFFLDRHCHRVFFSCFAEKLELEQGGCIPAVQTTSTSITKYFFTVNTKDLAGAHGAVAIRWIIIPPKKLSFNINKTNICGEKLSEIGCEFLAWQYSTRRNSLKPPWS